MKYLNPLKTANPCKSRFQAAFSLIELLVVIAVIGIIAAIAIPNIGNLTAGADVAKNQRNAQNLASVFSAARAAGNTDSFANVTAAVDGVIAGLAGRGSPAASFRVPNMASADRDLALPFLTLSATDATGQLLYDPAGGSTP